MNILIMVALFAALGGAILSGIVADAKNRNVLGWAVAGAIFPILGLIAIAGMPMAVPSQTTQAQTKSEPFDSATGEQDKPAVDDKDGSEVIVISWAAVAFVIMVFVILYIVSN